MFFAQVRFGDEVIVSTLPHPFSMFLMGFILFSVLILFNEYKRTRKELDDVRKDLKDVRSQLKLESAELDKKLADVSKKVDSRVDKAIVTLKKLVE